MNFFGTGDKDVLASSP